MADCHIYYDEMRFDVRDPDLLHAYVFIRGEGDCPHFVHGWHHKVFAKPTTTLDVLNAIARGEEDMLSWELDAPRPVLTPAIFRPFDRVPVPAEQLVFWRDQLRAVNLKKSDEMADQISAYLATVPEWGKVCPHCQAQAMLRDAQRGV